MLYQKIGQGWLKMACEKHGYTNNVFCPACDLEAIEDNRPDACKYCGKGLIADIREDVCDDCGDRERL